MAYNRVKNITHLIEVARDYEFCEFVEGSTMKGFDLEGIFVSHLNYVFYSNLIEIFIPQEIEGGTGIPKTFTSTNVKKLKISKLRTRKRPEVESLSQTRS